MTLDQAILDEVREGSQEVWRRFRRGLGPSVFLLAGAFLGVGLGTLWLLGPSAEACLSLGVARRAGYVLLLPVALLGGGALSFLSALKAVVLDGALLARLGGLLLTAPLGPGLPPAADQFGAFASPGLLARAARIRDLPLLMFLMRAILGFDLAPFLARAQTGAGRERLVQELEQAARAAAGRNLARYHRVLWLSLALTLTLPALAGWLFR
jgi:hypothetical protein